jgi:hypothetical protein
MRRAQTISKVAALFAGFKDLFRSVKNIPITMYKIRDDGPFVESKLVFSMLEYIFRQKLRAD